MILGVSTDRAADLAEDFVDAIGSVDDRVGLTRELVTQQMGHEFRLSESSDALDHDPCVAGMVQHLDQCSLFPSATDEFVTCLRIAAARIRIGSLSSGV